MCTGALNVAFSDSDAPYRERARQMLLGSLVAGISVFAGSLSGGNHVVAVLVAGVWAFAAGMLVALSQEMADIGVMSLVLLVVLRSAAAQRRASGCRRIARLRRRLVTDAALCRRPGRCGVTLRSDVLSVIFIASLRAPPHRLPFKRQTRPWPRPKVSRRNGRWPRSAGTAVSKANGCNSC